MLTLMNTARLATFCVILTGLLVSHPARAGTRGADHLFWVPTVEQALEMAEATGRPIYLVFYTCVGETSETYSGQSTVW